jgi:hypothetical protein
MHKSRDIVPLLADSPIGCHIQTIGAVGCSLNDADSCKRFDALLKHGSDNRPNDPYCGQYFKATLVSIRKPDDEYSRRTIEELEKRGFTLLATSPGGHGGGKMLLYGLGFTLPGAPKKKKVQEEE